MGLSVLNFFIENDHLIAQPTNIQYTVVLDTLLFAEYTVQRIQAITNDTYTMWSAGRYAELRDLSLCRLTMFNGRRGNEPARIELADWQDAQNGVWVNSNNVERLSQVEQQLLADNRLIYIPGKGQHLVPVIVPQDTVRALELLADEHIRRDSSVYHANTYLFPSTHLSADHAGGWHAVQRFCKELGIAMGAINATKVRHHISTLYAALDVPAEQRDIFYRHMGHSASTNANIYQAPLAEAEMLRVGSMLRQFESGR